MVLSSIFKTGIDGETAQIKNLRQAERYLPDNIYTALEDFRKSKWTTKLLGGDVKGRYADLKQASADRCPRLLGTFVKAPEVQYHHELYNQFLWNVFSPASGESLGSTRSEHVTQIGLLVRRRRT